MRPPRPSLRHLHADDRHDFRAAPEFWDDEDLAPPRRLEVPLTAWA